MNFSKFTQILELFYKGELSQADFTKDLLCRITDDESAVLIFKKRERNEKTFISYYTGERKITPIAKNIHDKINQDKFIEYLRTKEFNKANLCKAFKEYCPDIDTGNVFEKITEIYVEIIDNARNIIDKRYKEHSKENANKLSFSMIPVSDFDRTSINEILMQLYAIMDTLLKLAEEICAKESEYGFNNAKLFFSKLYEHFYKNYNKLSGLNNKLKFYNGKYSNELLNDAINLADSFTEDSFLQRYSKSWNSFIPWDNGIYKYQSLLVEISSLLDNVDG